MGNDTTLIKNNKLMSNKKKRKKKMIGATTNFYNRLVIHVTQINHLVVQQPIRSLPNLALKRQPSNGNPSATIPA